MALVHKDRVRETSTTTGTGSYTLAGAVQGFQAFSAIGDGNTCHYCTENGTDWEVGIGTYTLTGTLLARTTVLASSNAGAAVSWGAGPKNVFLTYPAERAVTEASELRWGTGATSEVANGASAVAFNFDTANAFSTAGAKLASWKNNGVEKFYIDKDGQIYVPSAILSDTNGFSIAGPSGGAVHLGSNAFSDRFGLSAVGMSVKATNNFTFSHIGASGNFIFSTLPTSDPVVAGAIWNNAGVMTISAG